MDGCEMQGCGSVCDDLPVREDPALQELGKLAIDESGQNVTSRLAIRSKPMADGKDEDKEQQCLWFSLLQHCPPAGGWGKTKRDEIARHQVVVATKPRHKEMLFVKQFDEWTKACALRRRPRCQARHRGEQEQGQGAAQPAQGEATGRGRRDSALPA
ncbi:MAG: hypothetical protein ABIP94_00935 [Planctomycetota bacterium]